MLRLPRDKKRVSSSSFNSSLLGRFSNIRPRLLKEKIKLSYSFFNIRPFSAKKTIEDLLSEEKITFKQFLALKEIETKKAEIEKEIETKKAETKKAEIEKEKAFFKAEIKIKKAEAATKLAESKIAKEQRKKAEIEARINSKTKKSETQSKSEIDGSLQKITTDELFQKMMEALKNLISTTEILFVGNVENTNLPCIIENQFDPRFLTGDLYQETKMSPLTQKITHMIKMQARPLNTQSLHVLLGPTGCGKTKTAFDIARHQYSIYLSMPNIPTDFSHDPCDNDIASTLPPELLPKFGNDPTQWGANTHIIRDSVRKMLLGRLFVLYAFVKSHNVTAEQWLLIQQQGISWPVSVLHQFDFDLKEAFLFIWEKLDEVKVKCPVPIILDEAQTLYSLLKNTFSSVGSGRYSFSLFTDKFKQFPTIFDPVCRGLECPGKTNATYCCRNEYEIEKSRYF
jgi:hypothetical protein